MDQVFKIHFRIGAQPPHQNDFSAFVSIVIEDLFASAPQAIVVDVLPVQSSNAVGITKVRRERLALAENGDLLRAKIAQAGGHPLDQRLPQHVEQAQRPAGKALSLTAVDNENGPYIHASHLGTAARNRLEREGTQDGTRRKREIGCKTRAR